MDLTVKHKPTKFLGKKQRKKIFRTSTRQKMCTEFSLTRDTHANKHMKR